MIHSGFAGDIRPHALNDPFSDNGYERGVDVDQFGNDVSYDLKTELSYRAWQLMH